MLKLVPIDSVKPSTYNPRKADVERLDILELSLRKLGFVLPLFADANGEILSGHQRHLVAKERLGLKHVPVFFTEEMDIADRKAINIAFNRGTNDLNISDTPTNMTEALAKANLVESSQMVEDRDLQDRSFYRCLNSRPVLVSELVDANRGCWINYARNMARMLKRKKVDMAVVCTPDNKVVNGIGRLQYAAEKKVERIEVIYISHEEAALSHAMLNLLSMDFDIHTRYEDLLRYNSFRRARRARSSLGQGFIFAVAPNSRSKDFDVETDTNSKLWKRTYGRNVVDFGAGHLTETHLLRGIGVNVTPFEPYRLGENGNINKDESIDLAIGFLEQVRSGKKFDSVFISSVLNSVPFAADRRKIACICAALCGPKTRLYACASSSTDSTSLNVTKGSDGLAQRQSTYATFGLDYEDGITIGDFQEKPKVQKYHSPSEFYALFKHYFQTVRVEDSLNNVRATCMTVDFKAVVKDLKAALEFEFNLPYPDGSKMGLTTMAIEAFEKRLGVKL